MSKIKKIGVNGNMFAFINDFISNRTLQVKVGNEMSKTVELNNDTPQGSVMSPILFLIVINDMEQSTSNGVQLSLFAYDSATYKSGRNLSVLRKDIQKNIDSIYEWCLRNGFKISIDKSCAVIFTKSTKKTKNLTPIKINGELLKYENEVKFLGVIFDRQLT